jgi:hypothetical protein
MACFNRIAVAPASVPLPSGFGCESIAPEQRIMDGINDRSSSHRARWALPKRAAASRTSFGHERRSEAPARRSSFTSFMPRALSPRRLPLRFPQHHDAESDTPAEHHENADRHAVPSIGTAGKANARTAEPSASVPEHAHAPREATRKIGQQRTYDRAYALHAGQDAAVDPCRVDVAAGTLR